jgi:hypothetical protein
MTLRINSDLLAATEMSFKIKSEAIKRGGERGLLRKRTVLAETPQTIKRQTLLGFDGFMPDPSVAGANALVAKTRYPTILKTQKPLDNLPFYTVSSSPSLWLSNITYS